MGCEIYREKISLYFDKELNEQEEKELFEHLDNCPSCKKEYEELKVVMEMLGEIEEEELPENFHNEVMAKIKAEAKPVKKRKSWARYTNIAASICALLLVGGAVYTTGFMGMGTESAADAASPMMYGMATSTTAETQSLKSEMQYDDVVVEESAEYEYKNGMTTMSFSAGGTNTVTDGTDAAPVAPVNDVDSETKLKIIKSGSINLKVKMFDEAIESVKTEIEAKGGYVENFNSYVYSDRWVNGEKVSLREGYLSLRVPDEYYEETFAYLKTMGEVTNENESKQNVTDSYIEVESRMEAKLTEEKRLIELLAQAENVDDIIAIEGRLSEVRGEIDGYQSRLDNWDKQVDYSTISVWITEDPDEVVETISPNLATRIKNSFVRGVNNFIEGIERAIVNFAGNIINIVAFAAVVVVIFFGGKKIIKKKFKKKDEE